jgi:hypothetical protein
MNSLMSLSSLPLPSLWQEALLIALAVLSLVYIFYFRIWLAVAVGSDLLFVLALGITAMSITFPPAFDTAAQALIARSPLPAALETADAKVASIEAMPADLLERALAKLGIDSDVDTEAEGNAYEDGSLNLTPAQVPGLFVSSIRPSVDSLVSTLIRLASFFCGSFMLLTCLAMRSSTTTAHQLRDFAVRIETIENALGEIDPHEPLPDKLASRGPA